VYVRASVYVLLFCIYFREGKLKEKERRKKREMKKKSQRPKRPTFTRTSVVHTDRPHSTHTLKFFCKLCRNKKQQYNFKKKSPSKSRNSNMSTKPRLNGEFTQRYLQWHTLQNKMSYKRKGKSRCVQRQCSFIFESQTVGRIQCTK
jgi:hypothetical protein